MWCLPPHPFVALECDRCARFSTVQSAIHQNGSVLVRQEGGVDPRDHRFGIRSVGTQTFARSSRANGARRAGYPLGLPLLWTRCSNQPPGGGDLKGMQSRPEWGHIVLWSILRPTALHWCCSSECLRSHRLWARRQSIHDDEAHLRAPRKAPSASCARGRTAGPGPLSYSSVQSCSSRSSVLVMPSSHALPLSTAFRTCSGEPVQS